MKKILILLLALGGTSGFADDLDYQLNLHVWGVDGAVGFHPLTFVDGQETTLWAGAGAVWGTVWYWRDPVTGQALTSTTAANSVATLPYATWKLGVNQGLVAHDGKSSLGRPWESRSLVSAFVFYRSELDAVQGAGINLAQSTLPDRSGLWQNSLLGGFSYDALTKTDDHGLLSGFYGEVSFEEAPRALQSAAVDFSRLNAIVKGFWPLYDLDPSSKPSVLSLLIADYASVDQLFGNQIPFLAAQSFGGLLPITGLGSAVRGVDVGRFDANFKFVNNLELRLNLPAFPWVDQILPTLTPPFPGLVAYFDAGGYSQLPGLDPGLVFSTGVGFFVNFYNLGVLGIYKDFWLNGTPFDPQLFRLAFGMQF